MKRSPVIFLFVLLSTCLNAQIGTRFPSEKKIVKDPVTGISLTFLTSEPSGDSKIYQTHNQWTSDDKWVIFRSNRVRGEAMAVNEITGDIVQVSEGGFTGMLNVARNSMKLYFMRNLPSEGGNRIPGPVQVIEVDLEKLFADSKAGKLRKATEYQRVCGTTPSEMGAGGDMALDGGEKYVYFRVGKTEAAKHIAKAQKLNPILVRGTWEQVPPE
jgi:oligogalacturonide lyase